MPMVKEIIKSGRNVEEAIEEACKELGLDRDQVQAEVLETPKKGFLGFGSSLAKVRVFTELTKASLAQEYIDSILSNMGITGYDIKLEETAEAINIKLEGQNLGAIIGRRGETLDAIQYLTSLAVNRIDNNYTRVTLDSGNYREKREKTLIALANRLANTAVKTGKSSTLEPMNPYERRIIHATVAEVQGAVSKSVGDEPNRKVVISSTNPRKPRPQGNRDGGKRPYNNNRNGERKPYNKDKSGFNNKPRPAYNNNTVDSAPKKDATQDSDRPLYSKIELD